MSSLSSKKMVVFSRKMRGENMKEKVWTCHLEKEKKEKRGEEHHAGEYEGNGSHDRDDGNYLFFSP